MVSTRLVVTGVLAAVIVTGTVVALWGSGTFGSGGSSQSGVPSGGGSASSSSNAYLGTAVHLFEWRYDDIADECVNFLGPNGFKYVQVSPPMESRDISSPYWNSQVVHSWSGRYQPVSYRINSRSGTEAMFANMVTVCNSVNVGIMVDMVTNHMAGGDATCMGSGYNGYTYCQNNVCGTNAWNYGVGCTGSSYQVTSYPNSGPVYASYYQFANFSGSNCATTPTNCQANSYFHHVGSNSGGAACSGNGCNPSIADYTNYNQVKYNDLSGLSDLATDSSATQGVIAAYVCYLLKLGVTAFRMDAGKHQLPNDIKTYLTNGYACASSSSGSTASGVTWPAGVPFNSHVATSIPFVYLEVIDTDGTEAIKATDFVGAGGTGWSWLISDFGFERNYANSFKGSSVAWLAGGVRNQIGLATPGISSPTALTFVANHDDERQHADIVITTDYPSNGVGFNNANVWMLTTNYGFPLITSSYTWPRSCTCTIGSCAGTTNSNNCFTSDNDANNWIGPPSDANGHTLSIYARNGVSSAAYPNGMALPLAYMNAPLLCLTSNTGSWNNVGATGGWRCQHRYQMIANAVGWRNVVNTGTWTLWNIWTSSDSSSFAYTRDGTPGTTGCTASALCSVGGWVAINNGLNSQSNSFFAGLQDGYYCNLYTNNYDATSFTDQSGNPIAVCVNGRNDLSLAYNVIRVKSGLVYQGNTNPATLTPVVLASGSGILIHTAARIQPPNGYQPTTPAPTTSAPTTSATTIMPSLSPTANAPSCSPVTTPGTYNHVSGSAFMLTCVVPSVNATVTWSLAGTFPTATSGSCSTISSAGVISCVTAVQSYSQTITVTASVSGYSGSVSSNYAITLTAPASLLALPAQAYNFPVNVAITSQTTACGSTCAPYTITPSLTIAGLTFNTGTGVLSGTPTATANAASFVLTAPGVTGSFTFSIGVTTQTASACTTFSTGLFLYAQWYGASFGTAPLTCTGSRIWSISGITSTVMSQFSTTAFAYNWELLAGSSCTAPSTSCIAYGIPATNAKATIGTQSTGNLTSTTPVYGVFTPSACTTYSLTFNEASSAFLWSASATSGCTAPTLSANAMLTVSTTFTVTGGPTNTAGGVIGILGNVTALGGWAVSSVLALSQTTTSSGTWTGSATLPLYTGVLYKAVLYKPPTATTAASIVTWQSGNNLLLSYYAGTAPSSAPSIAWPR